MSPQPKRMVGTRIPEEHAEELQMLASVADRSVSEIVAIAIEDLLKNPVRVFENVPAESERFAPDPTAGAGAAEHYLRREALTLAFHLTSTLLAAFAAWLTYEADKRGARTESYWEPGDEDMEIGYDVVGAVMRNANWVLDSWFSGDEYKRARVTEFLAGFTARDPELAAEYEVLLREIDRTKGSIEEIVGERTERDEEESEADSGEGEQMPLL